MSTTAPPPQWHLRSLDTLPLHPLDAATPDPTSHPQTGTSAPSHTLPPQPELISHLTAREYAVLTLIAEGWSNEGISAHLYLSRKTIECHIGHIFATLTLPSGRHHNKRVHATRALIAWQMPARARGDRE